MDDASKIVVGQPDDSGVSPNVLILRRYASNLDQMRKLILFQIDQRKITYDTIDTLVESLSEIIGGLDRLRYLPDIDELHSSLDEVQEHVTSARECLFVSSFILEKINKRASDITLLHENYDMFTKFLFDALELLHV